MHTAVSSNVLLIVMLEYWLCYTGKIQVWPVRTVIQEWTHDNVPSDKDRHIIFKHDLPISINIPLMFF